VRAFCESGVLFNMSHLKLHFALHTALFTPHTSHCTLHPSQSTLHTSHCFLHTSHSTLHTSLFTVHTSHFSLLSSHSTLHTSHFTPHTSLFTLHSSRPTLHTALFTLHSPHFTLLTAFFILHTSHFTLHTPHFTLHTALFTPHTSHCTLHTPRFISSELFSPYPSSSLLICHLSFHESLPNTTSTTCMRRAPARPVRACFVRSCCSVVVQEHDLRATPVQCNAKQTLSSHFTLHSSHPSLHTSHLHFALDTSPHLKSCELFSPRLSSSHLIPSLLTYI